MAPDDDGLVDSDAKATDGDVGASVTDIHANGKPLDEHPEQGEESDGQQVWEFEQSTIKWQDLIPKKGPDGKPLPVKMHRKQKGKTLMASGSLPDPSVPVDTVCETVLEDVKIAYTHDGDLNIVSADVTFNYAVRQVFSAKSEAARVALGVA